MGHALGAKNPFQSSDAAEFRLYVLAGCRRLSCDEVSALAGQLQDCVRERQAWPSGAGACDGEGAFERLSA